MDKGDRTFHELGQKKNGQWVVNLADPRKADLLQDVLDQLNLGEMPPKKTDVKQPKTAETKQAIAWLTKVLLDFEEERGPKETVLRRLNRREYRNTMRDLLGLHDLPFDFTENFPADDNDHGFTNVGDSLNLSDQHLDAYLVTADRYLRMAFRFDEKATFKSEAIKPKDWGYPSSQKNTPWMYRLYKPNEYLDFAAGKKQLSRPFRFGHFPSRMASSFQRHTSIRLLQDHIEGRSRATIDPSLRPGDDPDRFELPCNLPFSSPGATRVSLPTR